MNPLTEDSTARRVGKLRKLLHFLSHGVRLGAGVANKIKLVYLLLRWKLVEIVSARCARLPVPRNLCISFEGRRICLDVPDDLSFCHAFYEIFIGQDYRVELAGRPKVILDIGAQFGLASVYYACVYPDARIVALEPSTPNYRILGRNTRALTTVEIHQLALFSGRGKQRLHLAERGGDNSLMITGGAFEEVETTTLDEFAREQGIDHVDILKIDVEGAEAEILRVCRLAEHVDHIVGELHFDRVDRVEMMGILERNFVVKLFYADPVCRTFVGLNRRLVNPSSSG